MAVPAWTIADFIHRGPWWRNRGILLLNIYLLLPLLTSMMNGYDSSLVNGLQILPAWKDEFHNPRGKALGLINAAQMIGGLLGLPFTPYCSDLFGRRVTLFIGSVLMLGGVATQATAHSVAQFVGARVLIGAGLTFGANAAPLLITELAYPTQRGQITSIYNSSWYMGSIVAAWACFGAFNGAPNSEWSWRIPTVIQALGPVLQISCIWFIPESPRWLISTGREGKASHILARFHANGYDERDPLVVFEMAQIRHALKMEKEISKTSSFMSLIATPGNRKRMRIIVGIALFSQWSGNGLVSYYINLVLEGVGINSTSTKAAINGGLQIWNLLAAFTGAFLVDRLGRRTLFIISTAGMLIAFSIWTLTTALFNTVHITAAARATIPFIFIFYLFYDIAYTPMLVAYTLEILPFAIRAKGFAVMNLTVSLTLAFNQFVNPWALDAIGWKYYLVYCGWLGFELIFILTFIVETRGRTLEETAVLFDGEEKPADLAAMGGDAATVSMSRGFVPSQPSPIDDVFIPPEKSEALGEFFELRRTRSTSEMDRWEHSSGLSKLGV
ncbi:general substrate transporter [Artomyces pyxidatus]|uniref:General substrate transporter n=1 Tax=Artomyces pyxidatus TaxID=48021 RepID=A0ACB8SPA8_9AGAM|nr:general substrate transporter [Artomyces pyxidatus]